MRSKITDGDLDRALSLLPAPLFRPADIYDVAVDLGLYRWDGQALWYRLSKAGRIVRSGVRIGRARRWFYWQLTPNAPELPGHRAEL